MTASPSAGASSCTPTGMPSSPAPNGTRHGRVAGQVRRDGADVGQVHGQRVLGLGPEGEGRGRRRRRQQHVEVRVGGLEVPDDQRAHPLGLAVVGVVVAGRQGVGAEHDPALDLGAEAGGAGRAVHGGDVVAVDPQAVAHAVVAGQVARRLGRGDEVVRRQAVDRRGHGGLVDLGARRLQGVGGRVHAGRDVGVDAVHQLAHHADPQPVDALASSWSTSRRRRLGDRRGVHRVVAGDDLQQQRGVGHRRRRTGRSGPASWRRP